MIRFYIMVPQTVKLPARLAGLTGDPFRLIVSYSALSQREADRFFSSSRNSENDKAVGRESTLKGTTLEPRSGIVLIQIL
jgi:hypothetical protein